MSINEKRKKEKEKREKRKEKTKLIELRKRFSVRGDLFIGCRMVDERIRANQDFRSPAVDRIEIIPNLFAHLKMVAI